MKQTQPLDHKTTGQVFTPDYMVKAMLDWCGYQDKDILSRHIIDNSCGNGAFLVQVVRRYIETALSENYTLTSVKRQLETYIHGLDLDTQAIDTCYRNLNAVANEYGIKNVNWRIYCMNSLACRLYDKMMDYVVGNPPYVRLHHLNEVSYDLMHEYSFTDKGLADLYLAFFELSFRMLKKEGQLCYITPVSWLYSKAAQKFRNYILKHHNLLELIELGHAKVFNGVSTYTLVSRFVKDIPADAFVYSRFDVENKCKIEVDQLTVEDIHIDNTFCLAKRKELDLLRDIKNTSTNDNLSVKNGFATLADNIFINEKIPDSPWTIHAVKASTGQRYRCFYPYDSEGKPVSFQNISVHPDIFRYLENNRVRLQNRDSRQKEWWLYGRTQALHCVSRPKLAVNILARDVKDIKIVFVPQGEGVYSGYYIKVGDKIDLKQIMKWLQSADFISYIRALKKYKSGGYYTFSTKDLEQYLHHCLRTKMI